MATGASDGLENASGHGALARIDHFELQSDLGDGTYLARDIVSGRDVVVSASAGPNARPHDVRVADYCDLKVKKRLAVFPGGILQDEERSFREKFIREQVKRAKIVVADEFRHLVPPDEQDKGANESTSVSEDGE